MKVNLDVCVWNWKGGASTKGTSEKAKDIIQHVLKDWEDGDESPDLILLSENPWKSSGKIIREIVPDYYEVLQHPSNPSDNISLLYDKRIMTFMGDISGQKLDDIVGSSVISNNKERFLLAVFRIRGQSEPMLVGVWHGPKNVTESKKEDKKVKEKQKEYLQNILKFMKTLCTECSKGKCEKKHEGNPFNVMFLGGDFNLKLQDLNWEDKTLSDNSVTKMIKGEGWTVCPLDVSKEYLKQRKGERKGERKVREPEVIDYVLTYNRPWNKRDNKKVSIKSQSCKPFPYETDISDIKKILDHPPIVASIKVEVQYFCNKCENRLDKRARPLQCHAPQCEERVHKKCSGVHRGKKCSGIPSKQISPIWYCQSHELDSESE